MDIKNLKKEELLKIRDEINVQLKYIDETLKSSLSNLNNNDKIFCIKFYGSTIYYMDYVEIDFYKKDKKDFIGWTSFTTSHKTKPMGCSSCIEDEYMNNHFFLSEFCSSFYFFTLKPQNWKDDLKYEMIRLTKSKEEKFNKDILKFNQSINSLIDCNDVDLILNEFI